MPLKVEFEYVESPDEVQRINKVANILGKGIYAHLKKEGLLRTDPLRKEKTREAINKAREIINRDIPDSIGSA